MMRVIQFQSREQREKCIAVNNNSKNLWSTCCAPSLVPIVQAIFISLSLVFQFFKVVIIISVS